MTVAYGFAGRLRNVRPVSSLATKRRIDVQAAEEFTAEPAEVAEV